ncbi:hypothetical protein SMMN14_05394 [Sphaerulina musiva]
MMITNNNKNHPNHPTGTNLDLTYLEHSIRSRNKDVIRHASDSRRPTRFSSSRSSSLFVDNDEDNSIRHYQLDDEAVNFFPRVPGDTAAATASASLFKRGGHGMCRVLTLSSLVLIVVMMIMGGVVGVRKRRREGRRQRRQGYVKRRGQCGRRKEEEEEFIRGGGGDEKEEEEEFAKKCFVYNQNFEKGNWNFDALERGLGVVREEEEEEEEDEKEGEEAAGKNGNQNQNGRPLILHHHHHHVSLKAPVIVDLEDV